MRTQTHTKVRSESFCSDSKVKLLQLVQNPSTRWRYSRFSSHLLMQVSGLPQWCHSGFQPTSIFICCWFQSCSMRHCEVKTWEAYIHTYIYKPPQEVWHSVDEQEYYKYECVTSLGLDSMWDVPQWYHWHKLYSDDGAYNTWPTDEFLQEEA